MTKLIIDSTDLQKIILLANENGLNNYNLRAENHYRFNKFWQENVIDKILQKERKAN